MLKLFRRIRRKLLDEGKMSRYLIYAIGEILLVVIGILIALQVNNWNIGKLDHLEEQAILINLKEDFKNAIDEFESMNGMRRSVISAARDITSLSVSAIDKFPGNYLDSLFSKTLNSPTYNHKAGSLNVLLTSGKINLITNTELRNILIGWPGDVDDMIEDEVRQNDLHKGPYRDILSEYISLNDLLKTYTTTSIRFESQSDGTFPDNPAVTSDYTSILINKKFFNILRLRAFLLELSYKETNVLIEKAKEIIAIIDFELNTQ